jgi:hypothetical protein
MTDAYIAKRLLNTKRFKNMAKTAPHKVAPMLIIDIGWMRTRSLVLITILRMDGKL